MSITHGFFNANIVDGDYDRKYTADQLAEFFSYLLGNGISASVENSFKVSTASGMTVQVAPGFAWIKGFWVKNDDSFELTDSVVPSSGYRRDFVVLRFNRTDRSIIPMLLQGEVSQSYPASVPSYSRTANQYDLVLAQIEIRAGDSAITENMITDLRQEETYCGVVDTFASRLLPAGSVQADAIADRAITAGKIALLTIISELLADGSVTEDKLAEESISTSKIQPGAITLDRLDTAGTMENRTHKITFGIGSVQPSTMRVGDIYFKLASSGSQPNSYRAVETVYVKLT